jgi:hypothetical protein
VIPAGGFLLVWADNEPAQNSATNADLHVNFRLGADGEQIGLFDPSGVLVDGLTFGPQVANVSMGRFPDGAEGAFPVFPVPTPRSPNFLRTANRPPVFTPVPTLSVLVGSRLVRSMEATDPDLPAQTLTYFRVSGPTGATLSPTGVLEWTPTPIQIGRHVVRAEVRDSAVPPASAFVDIPIEVVGASALVLEVVQGPAGITLSWGATSGTRYRLESSTALGGVWTTVREAVATGSTDSAVVVPGAETVRLYRVLVLP